MVKRLPLALLLLLLLLLLLAAGCSATSAAPAPHTSSRSSPIHHVRHAPLPGVARPAYPIRLA
jgi:hypothetical protein